MKYVRSRPNKLEPVPGKQLSRREAALISRAWEQVTNFDNKMFGEMYATAVENRIAHNDPALFTFLHKLEQPPISIETFLDSPEFIGSTDLTIWPEVRQAVIDINKNWWRGGDKAISEAVLCGATSTGKTSVAYITLLYHVHILCCLSVPQSVYGLPKTTSIVFPIMAAKPHVTKKVVYQPIRKMIEEIPWFVKHAQIDRLVESEIYIKNKNIRIAPGGSDADSLLGEAVIGGIIDEINFMNVVLKSKKAEVSTGRAGLYDQAQSIHDTMTRRKKSRFITRGPLIGVICTSSSTRYKGDFTDKRKKHVEKNNEKNIYIYDKKQYEVWPQERYSGKTFRLLVGNDTLTDTRVLRPDEEVPEGAYVLDVPIEYEAEFFRDPHGSLRDVVGISTSVISPFFRRRYKITDAVTLGKEEGLESILVKDNVILGVDGMPQVKPGHYCLNPSRPRYVHIDLSVSGDRCGVSMVRFDGLMTMTREGGVVEQLPISSVELACSIEPDANNEIDFAEVRAWVKRLKTVYGYPVRVVTYDGIFSVESRQEWKKQGMKTGLVSVDKTSIPYKHLRDGINDGRLRMIEQPVLIEELFELEYDENKDKVDHPHLGSKDVADAVCGAYSTMLHRRTSWLAAASDDEAVINNERAEYEERYEAERA